MIFDLLLAWRSEFILFCPTHISLLCVEISIGIVNAASVCSVGAGMCRITEDLLSYPERHGIKPIWPRDR